MLNAMFKEFQNILGDEYGLFREFNPQPWRNKELRQKYKNLGVLYITNGNLGRLPDGALMQISYTLELFMRVPESFALSDPILLPLDKFATGTTGIIKAPQIDGIEYQYILDTGLPTSDGALIPGDDYNYIRFEIPISAVFTNGVFLANNGNITLTIDKVDYTLKGVISFTEIPQTQLETNTFLNATSGDGTDYPAMQNETLIVATGWSAKISKLYCNDQTDKALRKLLVDTPRKELLISYSNGNENVRKRKVIAHNCVFANELGQVAYMEINLSTAMRKV